jgi:6-pyruvoyltetrahydropterin/6-carboxytetrahydropterin synthase
MYTVAVRRDFVAQHYLVGGDWGPENNLHSHHYVVEVSLEGESLDRHGYLVDIVAIESQLEALKGRYRDQTLNDQPEFAGLNPSIEHFARTLCQALASSLKAENVKAIAVTVWENEVGWARYRQPL